jgi:hypothetical protein
MPKELFVGALLGVLLAIAGVSLAFAGDDSSGDGVRV